MVPGERDFPDERTTEITESIVVPAFIIYDRAILLLQDDPTNLTLVAPTKFLPHLFFC